jgi:hypothetical protein
MSGSSGRGLVLTCMRLRIWVRRAGFSEQVQRLDICLPMNVRASELATCAACLHAGERARRRVRDSARDVSREP